MQSANRLASHQGVLGLLRRFQRLLWRISRKAVEARVEPFDPGQRRLHQLDRGDLAGGDGA